jgi:hypothetical protein
MSRTRQFKALDLFCGAGGASKGLQRSGFHVTGVDHHPQPRYCGDIFIQANALTFNCAGFDFIWASPPCQRYSLGSLRWKPSVWPDDISAVRLLLKRSAGLESRDGNRLDEQVRNSSVHSSGLCRVHWMASYGGNQSMSRTPERDAVTANPRVSLKLGRSEYRDRDRTYRLDADDLAAMRIVGSFRAVNARDLVKSSVRRLVDAGLVEQRSLRTRRGEQLEIVVLSKSGKRMLMSQRGRDDFQRYHAGMVKPRELEHDTAVYPAYRDEVKAIEKAGGTVERVVLDFELKSHINSEMNRPGARTKDERRAELAKDFELPIINDHLALPDARIEYIDANGVRQHRDIEIVTEHYRGKHMAGKRASGFKLVDTRGGRAPVIDDHHLSWI